MAQFEILESRSAAQRSQSQAVARPSRIRIAVRVNGIGETRLERAAGLHFGAYVLEEPTFSFGMVARSGIAIGDVPLGSAIVLRWKRHRRMYSGADVAFMLDAGNPNISVVFTLTFEGSTLRTTVPQSNQARSQGPEDLGPFE